MGTDITCHVERRVPTAGGTRWQLTKAPTPCLWCPVGKPCNICRDTRTRPAWCQRDYDLFSMLKEGVNGKRGVPGDLSVELRELLRLGERLEVDGSGRYGDLLWEHGSLD